MNRPVPPHLQKAGATGRPAAATAGTGGTGGNRTRQRAIQERTRSRVIKERIRIGVRGFGEILITLGLVLLLFCAYQLWWTDVTSNTATKSAEQQIDQQFGQAPAVTGTIPPLATPQKGEPFARMYVPRFGKSWVRPIIQGTGLVDLHKGVGHYVNSALPGEVGNFAVAGHRTTNGHPFRNIDNLELGDQVFVETKDAWYTYTVYQTRLVVDPKGGYYVVSPTGTKSTAAPTQKIMTMTSCHPPYSASQRMVAHLKLTEVRARGLGAPAGVPAGVT